MILHPEHLFKFKPIQTYKQLKWFLDIINKRQLYYPKPSELNDPMEANSVYYSLAIAGSGNVFEGGKTHSVIVDRQEEFRIMSFSTNPCSPLMWAHYSNEFKGCCLVFSTEKAFVDVEPVIYSYNHFYYGAESPTDELYDAIHESFLFKNADWSYENEWRLIRRQDENIVHFDDELIGVIIGNKLKPSYKRRIIKCCDSCGIACFLTYVMNAKNCIQFIPAELDYDYYTPLQICEYMRKKEKEGKCRSNEFELFLDLNDELSKYWLLACDIENE